MYKIAFIFLLGFLAYAAGFLHVEQPVASIVLIVIFVVLGIAGRYTIFSIND